MLSNVGITCGKYILYELNRSTHSSELDIDQNVKLVKQFDKIKNSKLGVSRESVEIQLQNLSDFFVYFENDVPLGMMWGHRGSCYIRGPGISLLQDENDVYWFWGLTIPEARGKKIFKKLMNYFFSYYSDTQKFTAFVEPTNNIIRDQISKIGFIEAKHYAYIKLGVVSLVYEKFNKTNNRRLQIKLGNSRNLPMI